MDRRLLQLLLRHLLVGVAAAGLLTAGLLATDALGLATLMRSDRQGWLAAGLLFFGLAITLGSPAMGAGVIDHFTHDAD